ncbi:helix-turn-helix domain-containing protein [Ruminiclostridium josui]|uniref:helix-turn-helix domain-containing protein n=1 Tax=Ruminiclostridium josui TaxID=1499 RepID=UPI000465DE7F|nr:helix-turn-helix domain-containing protein [Ruminiclostridium josui]
MAARMRTIKQVAEYYKEKDPGTCVTEWFLREIIRKGKFKCHLAGKKYIINLDALETWLNSPPDQVDEKTQQYGQIRRI